MLPSVLVGLRLRSRDNGVEQSQVWDSRAKVGKELGGKLAGMEKGAPDGIPLLA